MTTETVAPNNAFGFSFIAEDDVPAPPRKRDVDTERWATLKTLLEENPNKWVAAKTYDTAQGAQSKSSQINNGSTKDFQPNEGWEARHKVDRKADPKNDDKGASTLYLCFHGNTDDNE